LRAVSADQGLHLRLAAETALVPRPSETGTWSGRGLWRYRTDLAIRGDPVTLGEGATPLVPHERYLLKMEGISPTGSFKDRGAATAITAARTAGARTVIEDSSGNAGTAIAAYADAAGLPLRLFAPVASGRMERAPRLHGVQSDACAPLVRGASLGRPAPVVRQPSIADGIRIPEPARAERSYAAVRYSAGRWIAVADEAIERAWRQAASEGLLMEPTA